MPSSTCALIFLFGFSLATLTVSQLSTISSQESLPPFYVVSHMVNTIKAVQWSMGQGANALEMDIRFNADGSVKEFRHGGVCDCSCSPHCLPLGGPVDICGALGCSCDASVDAITMFRYLATVPGLALVILDSKVSGKMSESLLDAAGRGIVDSVNTELFGRGYAGKVVISAGKADAMAYIVSASTAASYSPYESHIFHAFDQNGGSASDAFCSLNVINRLDRPNIVYGTGISACAPSTFYDAMKVGIMNRDNGAVGLAYVWTIDKASSMKKYLSLRPSGILTNRPGLLYKTATEMGFPLATPHTPIPRATSPITGGDPATCKCDCMYHPGGCRISAPAPLGMACKCNYRPLQWTCSGKVVKCKKSESKVCAFPDSSLNSCKNGGGDCGAYAKIDNK